MYIIQVIIEKNRTSLFCSKVQKWLVFITVVFICPLLNVNFSSEKWSSPFYMNDFFPLSSTRLLLYLTVCVTRQVSVYPSSAPVLILVFYGFRGDYLFSVLGCVVVFVFCVFWPLLILSLDCLLSIVLSVFSNVYFKVCRCYTVHFVTFWKSVYYD